jgi:stress-induced morphogen
MQVRTRIAEKLSAAFAPQSLNVEDESHRHEGHAGHRPAVKAISGFISYRKPSVGRAGSNVIA